MLAPSYSEVQSKNSVFRLNQVPFNVDWQKYRGQHIVKATFVQMPSVKKDEFVHYIVVQLRTRLVTVNLASGQTRSFETNSAIPFLQQHPDPTVEDTSGLRTLSFYAHTKDVNQQGVSQLDLSPIESPKFTNILEDKGPAILKIQ